MTLEFQPLPSETELSAIRGALAQARIELDQPPAAYASAWRRTAVREAVAGLPVRSSYAFSPRSTRGATRA